MARREFKDIMLGWAADIRVYVGGLVLFGDSHYQIKGHHMRHILNTLEPGDVLLRRYSHYVGSLLIPGYWSHAAVYEGDNNVIHMLGKGITQEDILTFMRADDIGILRCRDKMLIQPAIDKAKDFYVKKIGYDYDFKCENENLYCSELIHEIFGKSEKVKFKKYVLPDDLICGLFDLIWKKGSATGIQHNNSPADADAAEKEQEKDKIEHRSDDKV